MEIKIQAKSIDAIEKLTEIAIQELKQRLEFGSPGLLERPMNIGMITTSTEGGDHAYCRVGNE